MSWEVSNSIVSGYVKKSISTAYVRCIVSYRILGSGIVVLCHKLKKLKFETSEIRFSEV